MHQGYDNPCSGHADRQDPERDHQQIVYRIACLEFPWDFTRSLELALFRTFCVPSISKLLDRTGEFRGRAQKRYDDTDLIVSEMIEWGYDSQRGRAALRRMNQLHGRFEITNDDFLYVLSTFVFIPIRWIDRFGWRHLQGHERLALFYFWRQVGRRMGIADIPDGYDDVQRWSLAFERTYFKYAPSNHQVAVAVLEMFMSWFPPGLRGLAHASMRAVMDPPMIDGFGLEPAPAWVRVGVERGLICRRWCLRWLPSTTVAFLDLEAILPSRSQFRGGQGCRPIRK